MKQVAETDIQCKGSLKSVKKTLTFSKIYKQLLKGKGKISLQRFVVQRHKPHNILVLKFTAVQMAHVFLFQRIIEFTTKINKHFHTIFFWHHARGA